MESRIPDDIQGDQRMKIRFGWLVYFLAIHFLVIHISVRAQATVLEVDTTLPDPVSTVEMFPVEVSSATSQLVLSVTSTLTEGHGDITVLNQQGDNLLNFGWEELTLTAPVKLGGVTGTYQIKLELHSAAGRIHLKVTEEPDDTPSQLQVAFYSPVVWSGRLMIATGLLFAMFWRRKTHVPWRWFLVGAGIWAAGVLFKFAVAIPLNPVLLPLMGETFPELVYIILGSLYIGLYTGIFEIGVTLAAAYYWTGMTKTPERAVAVGIGAGAFEAILLGLAAAISQILSPQLEPTGIALIWLMGPVERFLTILFHTASRTLTLLAVYHRKWSYFGAGFWLLTLVDSIAGAVHLTVALSRISMWWVELALVPFAILSYILIRWCIRRWNDMSGRWNRFDPLVQTGG